MSKLKITSSPTALVRLAISAAILVATAVWYFGGQTRNPPGFYIDESSIAYNAWSIAQYGIDEHGVPFPLYFRAFGEYKNPTYIYLLSAVFKIIHPSDIVARRFSAILGYLACVTLAALAWRVSHSYFVTATTLITAAWTPMLFEVSRLAFEVALYPLILTLFLYACHVASERPRWSIALVVALVASLAALTYTYSIGRLLGPIFAVSLLFFWTRERATQITVVIGGWVLVAVLPILAFNSRNEGALGARFREITYLDRKEPVTSIAEFERRYFMNVLPIGLAFVGDPNPRHHVPRSGGSILFMTFVLAILGAVRMTRSRPRNRWLWFLLFGAAASAVPAALTTDLHHTLRLIALPVFLIAISIAALEGRRRVVMVILMTGLLQAAFFAWIYHRDGAARGAVFDAGAEEVIQAAIATGATPIYLETTSQVYIHAYWYGALAGVLRDRFAPHAGQSGVVITARPPPPGAIVISQRGYFTSYQTP